MRYPTHTYRRRGVVLLLTMVMIALITVSAVSLARRSAEVAWQAKLATADLQRRWAVTTASRHILPGAPSLLQQRWSRMLDREEDDHAALLLDENDMRPARTMDFDLQLGPLRVAVRLSDEQAKLNPSALLRRSDLSKVEALVHRALEGVAPDARWRLHPIRDIDKVSWILPNYERVFLPAPEQGRHAWTPLPQNTELQEGALQQASAPDSAIDRITLWGNGRVRLAFAPESVMRAAISDAIDSQRVDRLLDLRRRQPDLSTDHLGSALSIPPKQHRALKSLLTDESEVFSMAVTIQGQHRVWQELHVLDVRVQSLQNPIVLAW